MLAHVPSGSPESFHKECIIKQTLLVSVGRGDSAGGTFFKVSGSNISLLTKQNDKRSLRVWGVLGHRGEILASIHPRIRIACHQC